MPGVVFTLEQKLELARLFSDFGAHYIEMMPAVSQSDELAAKAASKLGLGAKLAAVSMLRREHVALAADCGAAAVLFIAPVSDLHIRLKFGVPRDEHVRSVLELLDLSESQGMEPMVFAEDATRADPAFLLEFAHSVSGKASTFIPCDTLGCGTPQGISFMFSALRGSFKGRLGFHGHNDFGLATANSLAAISAGAEFLSSTFCGIGERAGNAATEEVLGALRFQHSLELPFRYELLSDVCARVSEHSGVPLHPNKPLVGPNAFSHESGIHVSALAADPNTYENFDPSLIGQRRRIFFGKKSGKKAVERFLERRGLDPSLAYSLLEMLKVASEREQRSFSEQELERFIKGAGLC
jgi:isopropylmalate/homocitrate/citramalate synthase